MQSSEAEKETGTQECGKSGFLCWFLVDDLMLSGTGAEDGLVVKMPGVDLIQALNTHVKDGWVLGRPEGLASTVSSGFRDRLSPRVKQRSASPFRTHTHSRFHYKTVRSHKLLSKEAIKNLYSKSVAFLRISNRHAEEGKKQAIKELYKEIIYLLFV